MATGLLAALLASTCLGFTLLALSQDRHWHHLGGARHCPRRSAYALRVSGYLALLAGLCLSVARDGLGFGAVLWVTVLCAGGFAVACTLTWRPNWLRPIAGVCRRLTW